MERSSVYGPTERSSFDVLAELFARDIDTALLERARSKTFGERLAWLEEMQQLGEAVRRSVNSNDHRKTP